MQEHEQVLLLNGKGTIAHCRVEKIQKKEVYVSVLSMNFIEQKSHQILLCGKPKKSTCEDIVRQAVELGLEAVYFWDSQYSQKCELNLERIKSILKNALEQSNNPWMPKISCISCLDDDEELKALMKNNYLHIFHQQSDQNIPRPSTFSSKILWAIGPEGGFSENDLNLLKKNAPQFYIHTLSTPIMTTPTAVACAAGYLLCLQKTV